jgi:hypothetical protein
MACAPYLETLELIFDSPCEDHQISSLFDSLIAPALRQFSCGTLCMESHSSCISLASRSSCTLQSLSLYDWEISDSKLDECLRAVPSIHTLLLSELTDSEEDSEEIFRMLEPCSSATTHLFRYLAAKSGDI